MDTSFKKRIDNKQEVRLTMLTKAQLDKEFTLRNRALSELMESAQSYYYEPIKLLCEEYNNRILMGIKSEIAYAEKACRYIEKTAEDKIDSTRLDNALEKLLADERARETLILELDAKYFNIRDKIYGAFDNTVKKIFGTFSGLFSSDKKLKAGYIEDEVRERKEIDFEIEKIIDSNIPKFIDHLQFGKLKKIIDELYIKILNFNKDLQHRRLLKIRK